MSEFKGTKGEYRVEGGETLKAVFCGGRQIAIIHGNIDERLPIAKLFADAGNVRQQINCDLPELLRQRNEALDLLVEFCERVEKGEVRSRKTYAKFKEFIKKAN